MEFYTLREFANIFHIHLETARHWARCGVIPSVKLAACVRVPNFWERRIAYGIHPAQLNRWLAHNVEISFSPLDVLHMMAKMLAIRVKSKALRDDNTRQEILNTEKAIEMLQKLADRLTHSVEAIIEERKDAPVTGSKADWDFVFESLKDPDGAQSKAVEAAGD